MKTVSFSFFFNESQEKTMRFSWTENKHINTRWELEQSLPKFFAYQKVLLTNYFNQRFVGNIVLALSKYLDNLLSRALHHDASIWSYDIVDTAVTVNLKILFTFRPFSLSAINLKKPEKIPLPILRWYQLTRSSTYSYYNTVSHAVGR